MPHWFALPSATESQRRYIITTILGAALLAVGSAHWWIVRHPPIMIAYVRVRTLVCKLRIALNESPLYRK